MMEKYRLNLEIAKYCFGFASLMICLAMVMAVQHG